MSKEEIRPVAVRFPRDIYKKLVELKKKETRSLSHQVIHLVRQALEIEERRIKQCPILRDVPEIPEPNEANGTEGGDIR